MPTMPVAAALAVPPLFTSTSVAENVRLLLNCAPLLKL